MKAKIDLTVIDLKQYFDQCYKKSYTIRGMSAKEMYLINYLISLRTLRHADHNLFNFMLSIV